MKKGICWVRATAGFAVFVVASLALWFFDTPKAHLFPSGERVELGEVRIGQAKETVLPILNNSSTPIEIVGWSPTCHCMQAAFSQTVIPSGESINAYLRTNATTPLGSRVAVITIQWRYQGEALLRSDSLVVRARYVAPATLSEDRIDFSDVTWNDSGSETLLVKSGNAGVDWNGLEAVPSSDRLSAQTHSTASGFQVQIQINPRGLPSGVWKSSIRLLELRDGTKTGEELDVPVVARVQGPFSVNPPALQFFDVKGRNFPFTLRVHSSGEVIRKLHVFGNSAQILTVTITDNGKNAIVTGTLSKPPGDGLFIGKIPFQVNDGPEGYLQMSYFGTSS